jgi:hypothetical protein
MSKKLAAAALAVTLASTMIATTSPADAKGKYGPAFGFGIAAGALLGAAAVSSYGGPVYVSSGYRCRWVRQFDDWGHYMGTVKVCRSYY